MFYGYSIKTLVARLGVILFLTICLPIPGHAQVTFDEFFHEHNAVFLAIVPKNGKIVAANQAAADFYGYTRAALESMSIQQINALTAEEVAEERIRAKKESRNFFIFRHRLKNGDIKTVEVHSKPFTLEGQAVLISVIHDISKQRSMQEDLWHYQSQLEKMVDRQTEKLTKSHRVTVSILVGGILILCVLLFLLMNALRQQKSAKKLAQYEHERLNEIIWSTNIGTWEWTIPTGEVKINKRFAEMLGYTVEEMEPISIDTWLSNTQPDDLEIARGLINETFSRKRNYYETEFRMLHKDGGFVWVSSKGNVVEWAKDGQPYRMSGTHTDITERKKMDEEFAKAKRIAEEANHAKSEFLATMSHELRTPMMGIRGVLDLLRHNDKIVKLEGGLLDDLDVSSQSLMTLLDDILDLSKIEAGQLQLDVNAWEPAKIIENTVSLFRPMALKKDIDISTNAHEHLGYWCKTDDIRLRQVLSNLISNAVKFTESGSVNVDLDVELGEESDRLIIQIKDTGLGIPVDQQRNIFSRFVQADQSTTRKFGGTGLGLAIAKELTEMMGGNLRVKSKPGEGSVFTASLPVMWAEKPEETSVKSNSIQPLKILLAEDNLINQKVVSSMLERNGHAVSVVGDGRQAVDTCRLHEFDVILMDILMPEMDGMEATRRIRRGDGPNKDKPIVAFTADAIKEHREMFTLAGISGIVIKPVKYEVLIEEISKLIGDQT